MHLCHSLYIKTGEYVSFHIGWEGNKALFIEVWKLLPSKHILKTLKESPKGKTQRGQYLLEVSLVCYKWYQSQTPSNVLARRLSPKGGGHEVVWQQGRWALKGDSKIPHQLRRRMKHFVYKGVKIFKDSLCASKPFEKWNLFLELIGKV